MRNAWPLCRCARVSDAATDAAAPGGGTLSALLEGVAARRPGAPAIIHGACVLDWQDLLSLSRRMTAGLARRSLCPGDRIALAN